MSAIRTWISNRFDRSRYTRLKNAGSGIPGMGSVPLQSVEGNIGLSLYRTLDPDGPRPTQEMISDANNTLTNGFTCTSVILIPDLTQSSSETWTTDDGQFWPDNLPANIGVFTFNYKSNFAKSMETIVSYDIIRIIALRLLLDIQKMQRHGRRLISPVFIAHGYGGLICEQAYLFGLQVPVWDGLFQIDRLILFGTPHFLAGLAQWALISATKLGIPCADRPSQQDWSLSPIHEHLHRITRMQKEFRDLHPGPKMACYISFLGIPGTELGILPEWLLVPGARAIGVDAHHFSMTKLNKTEDQEELFELLRSKLSRRETYKTLEQTWIECTYKHFGGPEPARHASTTKAPSLTRDKIFSLKPNAEQRIQLDEILANLRFSSETFYVNLGLSPGSFNPAIPDNLLRQSHLFHDHGDQKSMIEQIHQKVMVYDLEGVQSLLSQAPSPPSTSRERAMSRPIREDDESPRERHKPLAFLDVCILRSASGVDEEGTEALEALFILKGDEITISKGHIEMAVRSHSIRADDVLELFLFLRGDQIEGPDMKDSGIQGNAVGSDGIMRAAAANTKNGAAVIKVLVDWYGDQIVLTKEIAKAAAQNQGNGATVMKVLLDRYGDQFSIEAGEYEIIKTAAANEANGAEIIEVLLDRYGDQFTIEGKEEIVKAIAAWNGANITGVIETLLDRYEDQFTIEGKEKIIETAAANKGNRAPAVMKMLLDRYGGQIVLTKAIADAAASNETLDTRFALSTLLMKAAWRGRDESHEFIRLLLETTDDDANRGKMFSWRLLLHLVLSKDVENMRLLLETGQIDDDLKSFFPRNNYTPLFYAIYKRDQDVVRALVDTEYVNINNVEAKIRGNTTALSWAAELGQVDAVGHLLSIGGIEVDARDNAGRTPLSWAAGEGRKQVVELLLGTDGIEADSRDNAGRTPLSWAAGGGCDQVVELLLGTDGIDVDARDNVGRTPLSWAAGKGREQVVRVLLEKGNADVNAKDDKGETPFSQASKLHHEGILQLLRDTGKLDTDSG